MSVSRETPASRFPRSGGRRGWNAGNLLVLAGVVALGGSFAWPYLTASRMARVESWAEDLASRLLAAAVELDEEGRADPGAARRMLDAMGGAGAERLSEASPPGGLGAAPGWSFAGKHYAYAVLARPASESGAVGSGGDVEVYAWPLSSLGPGRTAFFFAEGETPAYTYNLHARYDGWERTPRWGSGRPARRDANDPRKYRAADGERWIELRRKKDRKRGERRNR